MSVRTEAVMGTLVTIELVGTQSVTDSCNEGGPDAALDRAFGWFHEIEARCTRFLPSSELMQLTAHVDEAVPASPILFEAVRFARMVAEETNGAFDPTVGHRMEQLGFNREHRTGETIQSTADRNATWRDIELNEDDKTITLRRPLTLDLGAVAKGLAVDTAAQELLPYKNFAIDAGGDLYLAGTNPKGQPWTVGIRHPRRDGEIFESLQITDQAVCTSGDYERQHHILDPHTGDSSACIASATVVAPGAMLADALATAAFVLGPEQGIALLNRMGVAGILITPDLERYETGGLLRAA